MPTINLTLGLVAALAIFGQAAPALAAPTQELPSSTDFMAGVDTSEWISVEFQGKTITYNPSVFDNSTPGISVPTNSLHRRAGCGGNDCCGGSTFNPQPAPWARVGDCAAIRDWAYAQNTYWNIRTNTPNYHGVVFAGTCAFGAGTRNIHETWVGSSDVGDLTRDGIAKWAGGDNIGAAGEMGCCNSFWGCAPTDWSRVFWKLQCNGC